MIRSGRDFYSTPRIAPDGSRLCWLEWDLPWMPWDGCELVVGELAGDGSLSGVRRVAGRVGEESIFQPTWSPAGDLHFASRPNRLVEPLPGARRRRPGAPSRRGRVRLATVGLRDERVRVPGRRADRLPVGARRRATPGDPRSAVRRADRSRRPLHRDGAAARRRGRPGGRSSAAAPRPPTRSCSSTSRLGRSTCSGSSSSVVSTRPRSRSHGRSSSRPRDGAHGVRALLSAPDPGTSHRTARRPPLIVMSHGGPTAEATPRCSLETQFWTSRGFARRRRELRREHRLRAGVPTAAAGHRGDRRHRGLHQRRARGWPPRARSTGTGS